MKTAYAGRRGVRVRIFRGDAPRLKMGAMFRHLHIVACSPRSGTTLLHEAMVTCFQVDRHYEHEMRFNLASAAAGEILLTKRPKDTTYVGAVLESVPDFHVIYLLRDPRDVIVSRHGKDRGSYYSNIRLWRELQAAAKPLKTHPRFLEIRYEDFVREPDAVQARIAERFPWLKPLHPFSEYHRYARTSAASARAMNEVRPIGPDSVGLWRRSLGRIKAQQQLHGSLTPDLVDCGYETSAEWERVLEGVEPDFAASRYAERIYFWRRLAARVDGWRKVAAYRRMRRRQAPA